ncbi:hypothetical protein JAAARDRAFT_35558 [Jaapia argillacea MUCL 33604]|uniref:DSBA-like thioredoxin domain-containing protein n=1 Tax=Jaapia argillacea MUCL 33604 TaxID=933084 RepID=A0A067PQC9_9AGAM|nr:hypothetical protein JAAARDRAFT_35558 [Jaapia argillacea MUCL 33604]
MGVKVVKLTVISDIICPWCYIGQRELENAIEQLSSDPIHPIKFEVEFRPFRLLTSLGENDSFDKEQFYTNKFGPEKFENICKIIRARGKQLGLNLSWKGKLSQSTRAHRLLLKAYTIGGQRLQLPLLRLIFKAFLEEGKDIGDDEVLAELADSAGLMGKAMALKFLKSEECLAEVNAMIADARAKGITGVPFTVIDGKWAVSGGQSAEVYVQIFTKLATTEPLTPAPMPVAASA